MLASCTARAAALAPRIPARVLSSALSSSLSSASEPPKEQTVTRLPPLLPSEQQLFDLLRAARRHAGLDSVALRVAGGWVRDKLLGVTDVIKDIDVVVDSVSGAEFADAVQQYQRQVLGDAGSDVAVVRRNPDQSKHLETAVMSLFGMSVDFVQLRSESYSADSRIPSTQPGTPEEDAKRRDFTINALFYNLDSDQVEDFTELGLADLRDGLIRTPLPASSTLADDPLRLLRALRFAANLGFQIDTDLARAAKHGSVRDGLRDKVSRERVGIEISKLLHGPDAFRGMSFLGQMLCRGAVFASLPIPPEPRMIEGVDDNGEPTLMMVEPPPRTLLEAADDVWDADAWQVSLARLYSVSRWFAEHPAVHAAIKPTLLLAAVLSPLAELDDRARGLALAGQTIHQDLRLSRRCESDVVALLRACADFPLDAVGDGTDVASNDLAVGRWLYDTPAHLWPSAVLLRAAQEASLNPGSGRVFRRLGPAAVQAIAESGLLRVHTMQPLLDGDALIDLLGARPGPALGHLMDLLVDYQIVNAAATRDDAATWAELQWNLLSSGGGGDSK